MKRTLRNLRKVALAAAFIFTSFAASAQNYLIKEDFESFPNNLNSGGHNSWAASVISGSSSVDYWQFNNSIGYSVPSPLKGKVALADCYMGGFPNTGSNNTNQQDLALITPTVNTTGLNNLTLTFDQLYMQLASSAVYIDVSTDNQSSWSTIYSTTTGAFFSSSVNLNLSAYVGYATLTLRFRWTTPASTTHGYWMIDNVKLFSRYATDVGVNTLLKPLNNSCPELKQPLALQVTNFGTSTANSINVNIGVAGGTTGNFSTSISSLGAGSSVTVFTGDSINTTAGGNFNFTAYTTMGGDQTTTNDTLITTVVTAPKPTDPSGSTITECGVGPVTLVANAIAGEETVWYNDSLTATSFGAGNPLNTPFTVYASRRFYAENTRTLATSHSTGLTGVYRYNTNTEKAYFFNITAANEIVLDSFAGNFAYTGRYICSVYYRVGSYVGQTYNQSAFTLLAIDTVNAPTLGQASYISLQNTKLRIGAGQTYGFAVTSRAAPGSANPIPCSAFKLGVTNNIANGDISIYADGVSETAWTNLLTGYSSDITVYYKKVCKSQRKGIDVVIIPRPTNVGFTQAAPMKGVYRSGTPGEPDIVRLNDTFVYDLTPPGGFTNAQFGTGWTITAFSFQTPGGMAPNSSDTMTVFPSVMGPGKLRYIPTSGVDSVLRISITVLNLSTMCDTTVERFIMIGADPDARFAVGAACEGDLLTFNNTSTIASGSMTHKWYFGDGDSSELAHPKHTYTTAGSYNVRLISTSNYGFVSIFDSTVEVFEIPSANFSAPTVCDGATHQLTDASGIPSIGTPSYEWDFGDGSPVSTQVNPTHLFPAPDFYAVRLTVEVNGCRNSILKYVTLAPRAAVSFTSQTQCNNAEAVFSNGTSLLFGTYGSRWKFGDNTESTQKSPKHRYSAFGNVDVTLVVTTDLGCVDSVTNTVALIEAPNVDFTPSSYCSEETVVMNNLTTVPAAGTNGYHWDFGGGVTSSQMNPTYSFPAPGTYTVKLLAYSSNGCSDSITKQLIIDTKPIAAFVADDVCDGEIVEFRNNTINIPGGATYKWDLDNGTTATSKDTAMLYSSPGTYNVYLYASTLNGCYDTAMKALKVSSVPSATFTAGTASMGDGSMFFQGPTGSGLSYQWFLGDGEKETSADFIHKYQYPGTFTVRLVVTNTDGCSNTTTQQISVTPSGVEEIDHSLVVYPNPSSGEVHVNLGEIAPGDMLLQVKDLSGKSILIQQVEGGATAILNLGQLAAGPYFIEVLGVQGRYTRKIIITH